MRGTQTGRYDGFLMLGIIPADAGNTALLIIDICDGGDHPRGCGEHSSAPCVDFGSLGSSPRMRGTLTRILSTSPRTRIIPADAGNT